MYKNKVHEVDFKAVYGGFYFYYFVYFFTEIYDIFPFGLATLAGKCYFSVEKFSRKFMTTTIITI